MEQEASPLLKKQYFEALHWVADLPADAKTFELATGADRLELYGLREVILRGPCTTSGPQYPRSSIDTTKWYQPHPPAIGSNFVYGINLTRKSWKERGNMTQAEATKEFVLKTISLLKRFPSTDTRVRKLLRYLERKEIKVYGNPSQPATAAVLWLCSLGQIPTQIESKDSTHSKMVIEDNGLTVWDCSTILKYLCQYYELADHFYPSDIEARTRLDMYLVAFSRFSLALEQGDLAELPQKLQLWEDAWLTSPTSWLASDSKNYSIADVITYHTLLELEDRIPSGSYPKLTSLISRLKVLYGKHSIITTQPAKL